PKLPSTPCFTLRTPSAICWRRRPCSGWSSAAAHIERTMSSTASRLTVSLPVALPLGCVLVRDFATGHPLPLVHLRAAPFGLFATMADRMRVTSLIGHRRSEHDFG